MRSTLKGSALPRILLPMSIFLMSCLALSTQAQNTRGDQPSNRENRFKISNKNKGPGKGNRRIQRPGPRVSRGSGGKEKAGKAIRPVFKEPQRKSQKAWTGDISGRRLRTKNQSSAARNIYPQNRKYVRRNVSPGDKPRQSTGWQSRIISPRPRSRQVAVSNRYHLARSKRLQGDPDKSKKAAQRTVIPRSASRPFIRNKSIHGYAQFPRPKRKAEQAVTKDLAGRRLRGKNFETPRPPVQPQIDPYYGRKRTGDRPYQGPGLKKTKTATRKGQVAWRGDVANRQVRFSHKYSKKRVEGQVGFARKTRSATRSGERNVQATPNPVRQPAKGAFGIGGYQGVLKARRPLKGGGSVSGRVWNNQGSPLPPRTPTGRDAAKAGGFQGRILRTGPQYRNQGEEFTGVYKRRRPLKGRGSVSGKLWNNQETPIPVRTPPGRSAGRINTSGTLVKRWPQHVDQGEEFTGVLKARKPLKGGGSVSGKLWNNQETPIPVRTPPGAAQKQGQYQGDIRIYTQGKNYQDQGEEFTGVIRLKRFGRSYVKNPNSAEDAIRKRRPTKSTYLVDDLQVAVKQYPHRHNPSSADDALDTRDPGKAFARATDYQGNIKMKKFSLFDEKGRHPDSKFVKTNKNNVAEERDLLTNLKLWWARLFRKQETQPDHLKEKGKRPRYDKGEEGMWYD